MRPLFGNVLFSHNFKIQKCCGGSAQKWLFESIWDSPKLCHLSVSHFAKVELLRPVDNDNGWKGFSKIRSTHVTQWNECPQNFRNISSYSLLLCFSSWRVSKMFRIHFLLLPLAHCYHLAFKIPFRNWFTKGEVWKQVRIFWMLVRYIININLSMNKRTNPIGAY